MIDVPCGYAVTGTCLLVMHRRTPGRIGSGRTNPGYDISSGYTSWGTCLPALLSTGTTDCPVPPKYQRGKSQLVCILYGGSYLLRNKTGRGASTTRALPAPVCVRVMPSARPPPPAAGRPPGTSVVSVLISVTTDMSQRLYLTVYGEATASLFEGRLFQVWKVRSRMMQQKKRVSSMDVKYT